VHTDTRSPYSILPYTVRRIGDRYLVATILGSWHTLNKEEFRQFHSFSLAEKSPLFKQLYGRGVIVDEKNILSQMELYRQLHRHLFSDVSLHIVVLSETCNFSCGYCQTKKEVSPPMDVKTAAKTIDCVLSSQAPRKMVEFQGGEPLMQWPALQWIVKALRQEKKVSGKIGIGLVSNLSLLDRKKLDFLIDHNVDICTSLDGPEYVHDKQRVYADKRPTYKDTVAKIDMIHKTYRSRGIKKTVGLLPTITKISLPYAKEIIDTYRDLGMQRVVIRFVNPLGTAARNWESLGCSPEEFCGFWQESMEYILQLNRRGVLFTEGVAEIFLNKILRYRDPSHVDLVSPCGAGRSVLTYMPNGDVFSCDEARMIGEDLFKMGNVSKNTYQEMMQSPVLFHICQSSFLALWDYTSPYYLWSSTCPVINYSQQRSPVVKISQTPQYKIKNYQFDYLFDKIMNDSDAFRIFQGWVKKNEKK